MNWPTSQDYNEAIQNAATTISDPDLKAGEVSVNAIGLPVPRSGNFADVYQVKGADGRMWAVKCFTRHVEGLQERYTKINQYLERAQLPFTVGFNYLAEGMRIRGKFYPLLKMEWVEGFTLNEFVRQNADKPNYLHGLMQMWTKLTAKLRDANIAHADLQHGNVLLVPGNTPAKLGLKLIDYDGMWVPPLADYHSGEVGHPNFQHPLRLKDRLFNADVDRFAHLVIACALRSTVVGGKPLWDKFDNGDNLLFREQDLRNPEKSPIFKSLWELNDATVRTLLGNIALSSKQPLRKTPWLDDLLLEEGGPRLSPEQEKQTVAMLGVATPPAKAPAAGSLPAEFTEFEAVDDEDDKQRALPLREEDDEDRERRARRRSKQTAKSTKQKKNANLPLMIGGGVGALALIVVVLALALGGKKNKDKSTDTITDPTAENSDRQEKPKTKKQPAESNETKQPVVETKPMPDGPMSDQPKEKEDPPPMVKKGPPPAPFAPQIVRQTSIIGVAAIPGSSAYLFISRDDPALWMVDEGSNSPREIGRHDGPIRSLACSFDGNTVVTGGDDGAVRVWPLRILGYPKINDFFGDYGYAAFNDSVVIRNNATGKDERVSAGKPGHEITGGFLGAYRQGNWAEGLGEALSDEVPIFDGDLKVQIFQGGAMLFEQRSRKVWMSRHRRRQATPEKYDLKHHAKPVVGCAISPDGKRAASVGEDNSLCCWDLAERKQLKSFTIPPSTSVAFLPDGKSAIVGTARESAVIWDVEKGMRLKELSGHVGPVRAVCVSRDGNVAATGGDDGIVRIWDLTSGTLKYGLNRPNRTEDSGVKDLSIGRSGRYLASADGPSGRAFFDIEKGRFLTSSANAEKVLCISLFDNEYSVVCGTEMNGGVGRLSVVPSNLPVPNPAPKKNPEPPKNPDSPMPASGGLLTLIKEAPVQLANPNEVGSGRTVMREDGRYFYQRTVMMGGGSRVRVLDGDGNEKGELTFPFPQQVNLADLLFWQPSQLIVLNNRGALVSRDIEDMKSPKPPLSAEIKDSKQAYFKLFPTNDPKRFLIGGLGPAVLAWNSDEWKTSTKYQPQPPGVYGPKCAFPDGKRLILTSTVNGNNQLVVWSRAGAGTGRIEQTLDPVNMNNLLFVRVSPNGKWIVGHRVSPPTGQFFIWDAVSGKLLRTIDESAGVHQFIDFDPSGDFLVYQRSVYGPMAILDLQKGQVVRETGPMPIAHGAISRKGLVATVDKDRKTRLWQLDLGGK